ncbi:MAG: UDP-N-acetylmuramate dehydrogenase [Saprospiraceae bacterium]|nr:UDP-N-acetylmuramate dehydrogenase [Saprospiraceae bacterium]
MQIDNNVSGQPFNTFGINVNFTKLITIEDKSDLNYLQLEKPQFNILGGGSNVLIKSDVALPIIYVNTKGINILKEEEEYVQLQVAAGEEWHDLVLWTLDNDFGGIENLSLIPGKCGAAPMQNIGAYGVEIKDVLHAVKAYDINKKVEFTFHNQECNFGYRTSNFKTNWKGKYIITDIILNLSKPGYHKKNISYGAISDVLNNQGIGDPTIQDISNTIISIRQSKLPDPQIIGNSGSFFKNPIVPKSQFEEIQSLFPNMPFYPANDDIKIPAGWLIDQCGWKGKVVGNTGTYKNQALVLVNHGNATGLEIFKLSEEIQKSVKSKFNIDIEREVNVW